MLSTFLLFDEGFQLRSVINSYIVKIIFQAVRIHFCSNILVCSILLTVWHDCPCVLGTKYYFLTPRCFQLATFAKCEQLKTNPAFNDPIQMDPSSYWDMSTRFLSTPMSYNEQLNSFSFVVKNEKPSAKCTPPTLKIIMQTEVYGKMECDAFDEENFTNYIPIMPPPEKYCL